MDANKTKDELTMILQLEDVGFSYNNKRNVFSDISFNIGRGEIMSILGPNGSGKSTLLNCIANLYSITEGEIKLEGESVSSMSMNDFAKKVGYVPQTHTPAYSYIVRDFVVMGRSPYIGMFSKPSRQDYAIADEALNMLNIGHLSGRPYTNISGGERQQAIIARAIVQQPKIILMDEPTSHLDYGNQIRTIKLIKSLAHKGYSIIITTHMPDHVTLLGGKVGIFNKEGHMVVGPSSEIMSESTLSSIYNIDLRLIYIEEVGRTTCVASNV